MHRVRTTLDIDDRILRHAKERAAKEGKTLTAVIVQALGQYLGGVVRPAKGFKLTLHERPAKPIPGVDWSDRNSIYERMEGRG